MNSVYQLCRGDLVVMALVTATTRCLSSHPPTETGGTRYEVRGTRYEVRGMRYAARGTWHKAALFSSLAEE